MNNIENIAKELEMKTADLKLEMQIPFNSLDELFELSSDIQSRFLKSEMKRIFKKEVLNYNIHTSISILRKMEEYMDINCTEMLSRVHKKIEDASIQEIDSWLYFLYQRNNAFTSFQREASKKFEQKIIPYVEKRSHSLKELKKLLLDRSWFFEEGKSKVTKKAFINKIKDELSNSDLKKEELKRLKEYAILFRETKKIFFEKVSELYFEN